MALGFTTATATATAATAVFGGLTPYLAQLLVSASGWALIPGVMVAAVALVVLPVCSACPKPHPPVRPARCGSG
ncbi:hypothetical protein [Streptomyces sp. NBC_01361]|uniref:hypothetical protein n=1 Tax=Streptomyces sp. NBC_01361 TaxID=2903838 RepID=UPI003FCD51B4